VPLPRFDTHELDEDPIFFLETNKPMRITGRKLCAFESTAMKNCNRTIYVLLNTKDATFETSKEWMTNTNGKQKAHHHISIHL